MATGHPSPIGPHPAGIGRQFPERIGVRTKLDEHLPVDHRLSQIYRVGAGLVGLILVAFGILGLVHKIGFFDTGGASVAGLNTNGALSVLSIIIGVLLFVGMVIGGNFASTLNIVLGVAFLVSGFVNLALLETSFDFLAFRLQNVLFSFVVGLMLMWFGMYGRVSGGLPHDNPYWQARHPDLAEREAHVREVQAGRGGGGQPPGKWGRLDQGPGASSERRSDEPQEGGPQERGRQEGGPQEGRRQADARQEGGRRHARRLLRRRRLSGGAPGSAHPRPSA
ncbi:DUF4383 domain-containing protein [Streptomyces sp. NPDC005970]|uniref:DUF4383 domain-containing protein n=1 Tax=Streptomyces sp. NPDC005970 TaxID=3156723 RepID=UPI0033DEFB59